jgi:gluconolactonase
MKDRKLSFVFFMICSAVSAASAQALYDTTAKPKVISKQFTFTEGSSVDKQGNVFFTDQPDNKIWEYSVDGKLSVFMEDALHSNGTYFDSQGNLVACAETNDQLIAISPKGKVKILASDYNGHRLNGPNDVWVAPNGAIYFTDPYYQRDFWDRKKPDIQSQNVYFLAKGSNKPVIVVSDMKKPNGIVGTPDGKYLYVADIEANKTYKYTMTPDGSLTDKKLFVEQGSDGMTLDERGNVYLTGNGVMVYNPQGLKIAHIKIDEPWTANLCFCGTNKDNLFITASKAIYILHMNVKGVE